MAHPIITLSKAQAFPMQPQAVSERFGAMIAPLSEALGLGSLGATLVAVEPGKRAFPFHNHLGLDEMFVILEGEGTYRFGPDAFPVKAGDICAAPKGGPDKAHQLINTGTETLTYLGISSRSDPDVVEYPDSGKFAAMAIAPGQSFFDAHLKFIGRAEESKDYWDGEEL